MQWSFILMGVAIAAAGAVGVFLPQGYRWAVLLPLIAGTGVGIVGLAVGGPEMSTRSPTTTCGGSSWSRRSPGSSRWPLGSRSSSLAPFDGTRCPQQLAERRLDLVEMLGSV